MPSFKIINSILFICILFLSQINAQEIPTLRNASDSTQLPKQRLKQLKGVNESTTLYQDNRAKREKRQNRA